MRLSGLIEGAGTRLVRGSADVDITGLAADSRLCGPGHLFAALTGSVTDGRRFIDDALTKGSVAVLVEDDGSAPPQAGDATVLAASRARSSFAIMCARFHGAGPRIAVAVTGTNGKSSVADFCRQFWSAMGHRAASVGTLGIVSPEGVDTLAHTTPDPAVLFARLGELASAGITRVALEASSHGLDQRRLDGLVIDAAAFTNFSRDHLDYHATPESYLDAKLRLFDLARPGGVAVLNADIPEFDTIARRCRDLAIVSFGEAGTGLRLAGLAVTKGGHQVLEVEAGGVIRTVTLPLAGRFQAMNVLCAAALVASVEDLSAHEVLELSGSLNGVPGRLEAVPGHPEGARVHVDYAHTPDALETVLGALRGTTSGRLAVVFGCGGDRDRAKRPQMGAIATRLADDVYVTDDNPRTEDAASIRRAILEAAPGAREIGDRREAIRTAMAVLGADDVLVIAGKGHEEGQIVGGSVLPFDDREEARRACQGGPA